MKENLMLVSGRNASKSRVELKVFASSQFVVESIKLRTVADLALNLVDVRQNTEHNHIIIVDNFLNHKLAC